MKNKIRLGKFNYINVLPAYYNLGELLPENLCSITQGVPSSLNLAMEKGEVDISPVSAFSYAVHHDRWLVVPDICIGCSKSVISVLLASNYSFEELDRKKILLTSESASAASLIKILFFEKNIYPDFFPGNFLESSKSDYDGALIIGDNALFGSWEEKYNYVYDLGTMWFQLTGLPFVFGLWAVRKEAYKQSFKSINAIIKALIENKKRNLSDKRNILDFSSKEKNVDKEFMNRYFKTIEYDFDEEKQEGLKLFYKFLLKHKLISSLVKPVFIEMESLL
ncbi:MAG: hypothetical protein CSA18_03245 [Deltaproteobacteria bacterium]|nr:MAG: hypothetical protein CSA18_03245 [Deltaproteobacteria bacterium]